MTKPRETTTFDPGEIPCQEISDPAVLSKTPIVSVKMITYNHELYIAQAIEGVLIQETDFPIELVIGEDCSTDRTREIVFEYQKKHPDIIRVITSDKNVGMMKNAWRTERACRGKYIALCEGDDYWTDPYKLQRQVDFLEANAEYSMCSHAVKTVFEGGVEPHDPFVQPMQKASFEDIVDRGLFIPTLSIVYRRSAIPSLPEWFSKLFAGHIPLIYMVTQSGKNYHFDDEMAVKRKNPGGVTQDPDWLRSKKERLLQSDIFFLKKLNQWSNYRNKKIIYHEIAKCYKSQVIIGLRKASILKAVGGVFSFVYYSILWKVSERNC